MALANRFLHGLKVDLANRQVFATDFIYILEGVAHPVLCSISFDARAVYNPSIAHAHKSFYCPSWAIDTTFFSAAA